MSCRMLAQLAVLVLALLIYPGVTAGAPDPGDVETWARAYSARYGANAGTSVTPPGAGYTRPQLEQIVRDAAVRHGANAERLAAVVECESKWDPHAVGDRGRSRGLLQFYCQTPDCGGSLWAGLWPDDGPLPSRDDPVAASDAAARAWALGAARHWSCWRALYRG